MWPILQFSLLLIVAQFIPGPDFALISRSTLVYGVKAGVMCALGIGSALFIHCAIVCWGGMYLLEQREWLTQGLLAVAALWLLYLAYKMWPKKGEVHPLHLNKEAEGAEETPGELGRGQGVALKSFFVQAFITNIVNAKCVIFLATLAAPLLVPGHPAWTPWAIMGIAVGQAVILWSAWAYFLRLRLVESIVSRFIVVLDRVFSLGLVYFALFIVYKMLFS